MAAEQDKAEEAKREMATHKDHIIVRPLPKFVLMYPTLVLAFVCGALIDWGIVDKGNWSAIFLAVFFLNSLVMTFDFDRITSIAVALFVVVLLLLMRQFHLTLPVLNLLAAWQPVAEPSFYISLGVLMVIIFLWIFVDTRFDYWEITPNELLHHHGFLGDVERFPAPNLSMKKEIHDVFEFLLLGSGRLIFFPSGKDRPVVLDNVMRINSVEERVKSTLDTLRVTVDNRE
jgi:hypothetical protein